MNFPSQLVENAVEQLSSLPGIGKKSALRLVLHMLKRDKINVEKFGNSFIDLINKISYCSSCYSISDTGICEICNNSKRNKQMICIVEDIRVMMAIENTMQYNGVYHILGGLISPIDGVGPNDIRISELIERIVQYDIDEVIFALSTTMEGDTTNYYLYKKLKEYNIKISSIARGIATGDEIEYTDEITLGAAISSRTPYSE
ncbi:MAG: recombination mediator RecR [Flavobacteriales bacterium]|nr:recombination mediator RecR [Flavobacteriales bacterium]